MTKIEMARYIVRALYNMPALPPVENIHVQRKARQSLSALQCELRLAEAAVASLRRATQ